MLNWHIITKHLKPMLQINQTSLFGIIKLNLKFFNYNNNNNKLYLKYTMK